MRRLVRAAVLAGALLSAAACAGQAAPFNPDTDPSRIRWTELPATFGPKPDFRAQRFGVILKTPTNEYWRLMAAGYRKRAAEDGVKLDIQAAQDENDQARQLSLMQNMIGSRYQALLISPMSASNLQSAIDAAIAAHIIVINVDGAAVDAVHTFVGPVNREMGVRVAHWFIEHHPSGGKLAIIKGQAGVLSTVQRTAGFRDTLLPTGKFEIVASVLGDWDRQKAFEAARDIASKTPDLIGIYCNNDVMALGAVDAMKTMKASAVAVFGSDGTTAAYASIRSGDMAGTVDIFPMMTGEIGLDVAERLSARQPIPRVVETPQVLVTRDNISRFGGDEDSRRRAVLNDEGR